MNLVLKQFLLIMILNACVMSSSSDGIDQYYNNPKPMTEKESNFIDSLAKKNIKVKIINPYIGLSGYGNSWYDVNVKYPNVLTVYNKDSILDENKKIVKALYTNIIEDSIINDLEQISFTFTIKNYIRNYKSTTKDLFFPKDSLEKWCGFRVIKVGKDKYERVKV